MTVPQSCATPMLRQSDSLKYLAQYVIRGVHQLLFVRHLPLTIGLLLHALERPHYQMFEHMVRKFRASGYKFVDADTFPHCRGASVYLSFDDNYQTWYEALDLFDKLGLRTTFYVNTRYFRDMAPQEEIEEYYDRLEHHGTRITLSTTELREIRSAGHVIGAHTHSHFRLTTLPLGQAKTEISYCKDFLEDMLGEPIRHFSYPFGMRRHFNSALRAYCREIGFTTVANAIPGLQYSRQHESSIQRSIWDLDRSLDYNLTNIRIDGRCFEHLTGRSGVV